MYLSPADNTKSLSFFFTTKLENVGISFSRVIKSLEVSTRGSCGSVPKFSKFLCGEWNDPICPLIVKGLYYAI